MKTVTTDDENDPAPNSVSIHNKTQAPKKYGLLLKTKAPKFDPSKTSAGLNGNKPLDSTAVAKNIFRDASDNSDDDHVCIHS